MMLVCLLDELILGFGYIDLTLETSGFELASIITLVLQANELTKCASHPRLKKTFPRRLFEITQVIRKIRRFPWS